MRSLLLIVIGAVLAGGYVQWTAQPSEVLLQGHAASKPAKIVRTKKASVTNIVEQQQTTPSVTVAKTAAKPKPQRRVLDLSIPSIDDTTDISFPSKRRANWLKKVNPKETISYNAELVFDAKEGSSITGGKVNIRIPLG